MIRLFVPAALALTLCLAVSVAQGEQRGKAGGASRGGKPPGGEWSQRTHSGKQGMGQHAGQHGKLQGKAGGGGAAAGLGAGKGKAGKGSAEHGPAAGAAASKRKSPQASGEQGAAAGAAAANRRSSQASGAEGAAAGAAANNRRSPQATGEQGAAAGAAAANRRAPNASGAEGAAAGAAAANRRAPNATGAEGAAAGAAVANRNSPAYSGADGAAAGYAAVRNSFNHRNLYGAEWYGEHSGAWAPTGWAAGAVWAPSTWGAVASYCGYGDAAPVSYNYGVNVTAQDGNVSVDGQNVGTTEEFSQQASDLAATGTEAETSDTDEWLPLGVFAMVRDENQHAQLIVQLAINRQGILRGNYTDELTDHTLPIHGAADKETQRAAWTVGDNKNTVMEAGLNDLTQSEAPALIHKNGKTDHWLLVRLQQPPQDGTDAGN